MSESGTPEATQEEMEREIADLRAEAEGLVEAATGWMARAKAAEAEVEQLRRANGALVSGRPEADDPGACPGCGRDWGEPSELESRLPFPSFEAEDWRAAIAERNAAEAERDALRAALRDLVEAVAYLLPHAGDGTPYQYAEDTAIAMDAAGAALAGVDHGE